MSNISEPSQKVLMQATSIAQKLQTSMVTPLHLLLGLLSNSKIQAILRYVNVDILKLIADIHSEVYRSQGRSSSNSIGFTVTHTDAFQDTIVRAVHASQNAGKPMMEVEHLLVALFDDPSTSVTYCFNRQGVDRLAILEAINQVHYEREGMASDTLKSSESTHGNPSSQDPQTKRDVLKEYAIDLNARAASGNIDPLIGRTLEVNRIMQTLCRRRKNNPLLVGEPGVGKTALAEGLAWRIVKGNVPEALKETTVYALDMGSLMAGTKYRGDFEARIKGVLDAVKKDPRRILFIDEIHTIIGAGSSGGNAMDAANLLKPSLADGSLRVIGSTTFSEFREVFDRDRALSRRFQKIDVIEPTPEETLAILQGARPALEAHHGVRYSDEALQAAIDLSIKYMTDRLLPDKAIDVVDEAGARQKLLDMSERTECLQASDMENIIAQMAKIPVQQVSTDDRTALAKLAPSMKEKVFGQDEAIARLTSAIMMARAGLSAPERPLGSFLFVGPTGVGKTEVTRQMASTLGMTLLRFDMSEYMEAHSVSRLIGAPPGYVGYDKGGLLTDAVWKAPSAVILLDEIEKAHPDIQNVLLQIMDHGSLTDTNGRQVNFRNTVIVMTSNAGAQQASRRTLGFVEQNHSSDSDEAVRRSFSPEFRNRLDAIIRFNALTSNDVMRVLDKNLMDLSSTLALKGVTLTLDEAARDWLATQGFSPDMGARPMARVISDRLKSPLSEALLFGVLSQGGSVHVSTDAHGLLLTLKSSQEASEAVLEEVC